MNRCKHLGVFCMFLAFLCIGFSASATEVHEVFDIPFDLEPVIYAERLEEALGIALSRYGDEGNYFLFDTRYSDKLQWHEENVQTSIRIQDNQVKCVIFHFSSEVVGLFFERYPSEETVEREVARVIAIAEACEAELSEKYGSITGGRFVVEPLYDSESWVTLPITEGKIGWEEIEAAMKEQEMVSVHVAWGNVVMGLYIECERDQGMEKLGISTSITMEYYNPNHESYEPLDDFFEGKDYWGFVESHEKGLREQHIQVGVWRTEALREEAEPIFPNAGE